METLFWVAAKIFWLIASPDKLLFILFVVGTGLLWTQRQALGKKILAVAASLLMLFALLPLDSLLLKPLENRFPQPDPMPENVAGIVVLGGAEMSHITAARNQASFTEAGERLTASVALARRYPKARLVHTGGIGNMAKQHLSSTETARKLFTELGLDLDRVQFESNSRNTIENAKNAYALAKPKPEETWLLVTSASHIPRAVGVFRNIGWNVLAYPVDYDSSGSLTADWAWPGLSRVGLVSSALHEWAGLFIYRITGKTQELLPAP